MIFADHRPSVGTSTLLLTTRNTWLCSLRRRRTSGSGRWDRAAHHLKLKYPEGEIDFIVTAPISSLPPIEKQIDLTAIRKGSNRRSCSTRWWKSR